jgi:hypothetical protein
MLMLKYLILFWSIFVLFSVISDGGAPIRNAEDNMQSILSKTLNAFANQADNIKDQADNAKDKIKDFKILPGKQ